MEGKSLSACDDKDKSHCDSQIHYVLLKQYRENKGDGVVGFWL